MDVPVDIICDDSNKGAERLFEEYGSRLMASAVAACGNESTAEDLVWESIDIAVRQIKSYRLESGMFEWLHGIMLNRYRQTFRRKSAVNEFSVSDLPDESADVEVDGAEQVIKAIDAKILKEAVDSLPKEMRETVVLRYFMDMSIANIARFLSIPSGTVKSRIYYARVALSKRLGTCFKNPILGMVAAASLLSFASAAAIAVSDDPISRSASICRTIVRMFSAEKDTETCCSILGETGGKDGLAVADEGEIFQSNGTGNDLKEKGDAMTVNKMASLVVSAAMAAAPIAAEAVDHEYEWKSGETPSSVLDGRVVITYDSEDKILSMKVTPENSGKIIFTGEKMQFHTASGDGYITNAAPGTLVFRNEVGMRSLSMSVETPCDLTWEGYSTFVGGEWVTLANGVNLDDYEPGETVQTAKSETGDTLYYWANRGYRMYPCSIFREPGRLVFQYQTKTDNVSGRKCVMVVKLELMQFGSDVRMRIASPAYKVWSDADSQIDRGFDVDALWIGADKEAVPLRTTGSSVTGIGINTVMLKYVGIRAVCRFEGAVTITGSAVPCRGTRFEVAYKLNNQTYPNPKEGGVFALMDRSRDITWCSSIGTGTFLFETTKPLAPYATNKVSVTGDWLSSGRGDFVVKGLPESPMILDILDNRALPPNGRAIVKSGGILRLSASGVDAFSGLKDGTCAIHVERGGIVQQGNVDVFATNQVLIVDGGVLELGTGICSDNSVGTDIHRITLRNGARVMNSGNKDLCIGNTLGGSMWTVSGESPSTNTATAKFRASNGKTPTNTFNVVSTGNEYADFVWAADFLAYEDATGGHSGVMRKTGYGTMAIDGRYEIPGEVVVEGGFLRLASSGMWGRDDIGRTPIVLAGGGLAVDSGTTNILGDLVVKADSVLLCGEGSELRFPDISGTAWTDGKTLSFNIPTNSAGAFLSSVRFGNKAAALSDIQLWSLNVNGGIRVELDDHGLLRPFRRGMVITVR